MDRPELLGNVDDLVRAIHEINGLWKKNKDLPHVTKRQADAMRHTKDALQGRLLRWHAAAVSLRLEEGDIVAIQLRQPTKFTDAAHIPLEVLTRRVDGSILQGLWEGSAEDA